MRPYTYGRKGYSSCISRYRSPDGTTKNGPQILKQYQQDRSYCNKSVHSAKPKQPRPQKSTRQQQMSKGFSPRHLRYRKHNCPPARRSRPTGYFPTNKSERTNCWRYGHKRYKAPAKRQPNEFRPPASPQTGPERHNATRRSPANRKNACSSSYAVR